MSRPLVPLLFTCMLPFSVAAFHFYSFMDFWGTDVGLDRVVLIENHCCIYPSSHVRDRLLWLAYSVFDTFFNLRPEGVIHGGPIGMRERVCYDQSETLADLVLCTHMGVLWNKRCTILDR